ncbi:MAG: hypothetical protein K8I27_00800 [Planctomycetes bacterium]|nr:hypothetical protein [Planctomycetota bacterium]
MAQTRVFRGRYVELLFGIGIGKRPLSPMELMGYAKSGRRRELLACGSVPPDTVKKLPAHDLWRHRNQGEIPKRVVHFLRAYDSDSRNLCFDAALAYVWTYQGSRPDFDEEAMSYLSGEFPLLSGTRIVANELGLAWVDPVSVDTTVFIAHSMILRVGVSRTRRDKRISSGSNPRIT